MRKGFFIRFVVILSTTLLCVFIMFLVDFNLIASCSKPKFCLKKVEHKNDTEYIGILYKIIKYKINDNEQKLKVGTLTLKYDENFALNFKTKIDIRGYIREINDLSPLVIYVESNGYATKKYDYNKAYAVITGDTKIGKNDDGVEYKKSDLKVGQVVEVSFITDVQQLEIPRATAGYINIIKDVESEEKEDE